MSPTSSKPWHVLRQSRVHGTGVYAARKIPEGTRVFEYVGEVISGAEADRRHPVDPDDPFHTFFFALSNGRVIDGGVDGNDARWINHSCEPNCETEETDDYRVFVVALRDIARGEELYFDYGLTLDERLTKKVKEQYRCLCGTPSCRGTMLALKRKPPAKAVKRAPIKKVVKKTVKKAVKSAVPAKAVKSTGPVKAAKKAASAGKAVVKKAGAKKAVAKKAGTAKVATKS